MIRRAWDIQWASNWWLSLGFHFDHTDPSLTLHLPGIVLCVGRCKLPGFHHGLRQKPKDDGCWFCGGQMEFAEHPTVGGESSWWCAGCRFHRAATPAEAFDERQRQFARSLNINLISEPPTP